jgi:hypothetical protein
VKFTPFSPLQNNKLTMPKEKSINPAQAQRKAEKAKAVKKGASIPRPLNQPQN